MIRLRDCDPGVPSVTSWRPSGPPPPLQPLAAAGYLFFARCLAHVLRVESPQAAVMALLGRRVLLFEGEDAGGGVRRPAWSMHGRNGIKPTEETAVPRLPTFLCGNAVVRVLSPSHARSIVCAFPRLFWYSSLSGLAVPSAPSSLFSLVRCMLATSTSMADRVMTNWSICEGIPVCMVMQEAPVQIEPLHAHCMHWPWHIR